MKIKLLLHRFRKAIKKVKTGIKKIISEFDLSAEEDDSQSVPEFTTSNNSPQEGVSPAEILDLEPIEAFFEEYIGAIIVDIVDVKNIDNLGFEIPKIVTSVYIEDEGCKFELSDVDGKGTSYLTVYPSKFGTFVEKESEETFEANATYRIAFYGGFCLEYSDARGLGKLIYEE